MILGGLEVRSWIHMPTVPVLNPGLGSAGMQSCVLLTTIAPRPSDETLNRGLVCVRMHLSSCTDLKYLS